ncbi:MAG: sugar phosphate isomerase/epimerase, partial [Clostridia bacterium]|nr:sugar phosphate isomerase/epimerase [Clostridia bacterium]
MKVGVSTATFFSKLLTEDTLSVIKNIGGDCAEVFLSTYCEYEPDFASLLKDRKSGLDIYSMHSLNTQFEPQLFNSVERTRKDAESIFNKVLATGQTLGARVYVMHGQSRLKKSTSLNPEKVGKRLKELGDMCLDYGMTLCFENVDWAAFNTPEFFAVAKEFAPNIGATLDIKQAWRSGYDWREYLDVMGDRLKNVHVCDKVENTEASKTCLVGKGVFPFAEFIDTLKEKGYDGPMMIEQYSSDFV